MISVIEAEELILSRSLPADFTLVDIQEIQGEALRQPIVADRDYPPFNRVAMDGIAISCIPAIPVERLSRYER